jgi:hypothetical protein
MIASRSSLFNDIITRASLDINDAHRKNKSRIKGRKRHGNNQRLAAAISPPLVITPRLRKASPD